MLHIWSVHLHPTHKSTQEHTVVGARVNGHVDLVDILLRVRASLGSANRTLVVRVADLELVVVGGEGLQLGSFDLIVQLADFLRFRSRDSLSYLDSVVNVGAGEHSTLRHSVGEGLILRHHVVQANRGIRHGLLVLRDGHWDLLGALPVGAFLARVNRDWVVEGNKTHSRAVRVNVIVGRRATSPQNHRLRVGVSGGNAVGEVQLGWVKGRSRVTALHNPVNRDTQSRVVLRRTAVVQVASIARSSRGCRGQDNRPGELHVERNESTSTKMVVGVVSAAKIYRRLTSLYSYVRYNKSGIWFPEIFPVKLVMSKPPSHPRGVQKIGELEGAIVT